MKGAPRSLEEWLFYKLMNSQGFHRFVRRVYYKVNGINPHQMEQTSRTDRLFHPTGLQKFKAYRMLFWDEVRSVVGLPRITDKYLKK
ncbi:Mrx7p [Kluyveromyces lactis]|uniref:KLLA0D19140p n=1 Tax=Kluyveromyces lactis (strain ATCC 8585 / CBS 2359 / DSM 70799 / NBRC 1267 / NRRL Y-1140 / WM37) TaxID=284590 RepID=Q6CQ78_KLULA|nr:uncharacterized protein KLLA0_D19140g [Kluyveromyces lactis]CAH01007.1 KLLA0D19140p [Kluyveromyces lactis]|eukprot:XP_453911.1 uncharacterized protein KLLA0_D19140g [Kluyveromyces lactis]